MATKSNSNRPKNNGFDYPVIGGKAYPKGSTIKKNSDGTVTVVPPKKKK